MHVSSSCGVLRRFLFTGAALLTALSAAAAPLRFAAMEMPKPDPCLPFITETHAWLNENYPEGATFRYYALADLEKAVRNREVDVVLTEAGVAGRLRFDGARPLFSAVSQRHKDPKRSQGSVFFVRDDSSVETVAQLRGRSLSATTPNDFTGFQVAMGELVRRNYNPDGFFRKVHFIGTASKKSMQDVVNEVLNGKADAGVVRTCFLEDLEKMMGQFLPLRVVEPRDDPTFACKRSTELYPNWTISSVPSLPASELREVMALLLAMPPTKDGMYWSVASDFSAVDKLMQDLHIGPYEELREWTWRRVWDEYGIYIMAVLAAVALGALHQWRTSHLLTRRTEELQAAFDEKVALHHKIQNQERRFEKLQRSTAVGQMSNMFVHELKQPLQTISCFSHGLLRTMETGKEHPELLREGLEKIETEVHHAGEIIERVRNYAKGRDAERKPCDLYAMASETVKALRQKDPRVQWTVSGDAIPFVLPADDLECNFIFHCLLKNAAEASCANRDTSPAVSVRFHTDEKGFEVEIVDSGPRLSDEDFERLTTPLSSSKTDGMGLGLTVTRSLLEKYRATLKFERLDRGVRTILQFPADAEGREEEQASKNTEEKDHE